MTLRSGAGFPLYRGNWPQNVSRLAKYAVRLVEGDWKITVLCELAEGLRYLAVYDSREQVAGSTRETGAIDAEGLKSGGEVVKRVNHIKQAVGEGLGGAFYVNEYRHLLVPVRASDASGTGSHYYYGGRVDVDFTFEYEGQVLSSKPEGLQPGDPWKGPRPGIPYKLAAAGGDIYFESPEVGSDGKLRHGVTHRVYLSKVLGANRARGVASQVAAVKGWKGGRFYVNEHRAMFAPMTAGDGNGIDYIYCGEIDLHSWFPEPEVPGLPI